PPDLLIYLKASVPTLVDHIQQRGRQYEDNMSRDYLKRLNKRYEDWIATYTAGHLLVINADEVDFHHNPAGLSTIIQQVQNELPKQLEER
ncbi:MAG: deoxynucleoside kinase, partial [Bacteroidota bacterium]